MLDSIPAYHNQLENDEDNALNINYRKTSEATCTKSTQSLDEVSTCPDDNKSSLSKTSIDTRRTRRQTYFKSFKAPSVKPKSKTDDLIAYRQMIADCVTRKVVIPLTKIDDQINRMNTAFGTSNKEQLLTVNGNNDQDSEGDFVCVISDVRGDAMDVYDDDNCSKFKSDVCNDELKQSPVSDKFEVNECFMNLLETVETMNDHVDSVSIDDTQNEDSDINVDVVSDVSDSELIIDTETPCEVDLVDENYLRRNCIKNDNENGKTSPYNSFSVHFIMGNTEDKQEDQKVPKLLIKNNNISKSSDEQLSDDNNCNSQKNTNDSNESESSTASISGSSIACDIKSTKDTQLDSLKEQKRGKRSSELKSRQGDVSAKKKARSQLDKPQNNQAPIFSDVRLANELPGFNWLENKIKNNSVGNRYDCRPKNVSVHENCNSELKKCSINGLDKKLEIDPDVVLLMDELVRRIIEDDNAKNEKLHAEKAIENGGSCKPACDQQYATKLNTSNDFKPRMCLRVEPAVVQKPNIQSAVVPIIQYDTQTDLVKQRRISDSVINVSQSKNEQIRELSSKRPTSSPSYLSKDNIPQLKNRAEYRPASAENIQTLRNADNSMFYRNIGDKAVNFVPPIRSSNQPAPSLQMPVSAQAMNKHTPPLQPQQYIPTPEEINIEQHAQILKEQLKCLEQLRNAKMQNSKGSYSVENYRHDSNLVRIQEKLQRSSAEQNAALIRKQQMQNLAIAQKNINHQSYYSRPTVSKTSPYDSPPSLMSDAQKKFDAALQSPVACAVTSPLAVNASTSMSYSKSSPEIPQNRPTVPFWTNSPPHKPFKTNGVVHSPSAEVNNLKPVNSSPVQVPPGLSSPKATDSKADDEEITILSEASRSNGSDSGDASDGDPQKKLALKLQKYKKELYLLEQMAQKREHEKRKLMHLHGQKLGILESLERKHRTMQSTPVPQPPTLPSSSMQRPDNSTLLKLLKSQKEGLASASQNFNLDRLNRGNILPSHFHGGLVSEVHRSATAAPILENMQRSFDQGFKSSPSLLPDLRTNPLGPNTFENQPQRAIIAPRIPEMPSSTAGTLQSISNQPSFNPAMPHMNSLDPNKLSPANYSRTCVIQNAAPKKPMPRYPQYSGDKQPNLLSDPGNMLSSGSFMTPTSRIPTSFNASFLKQPTPTSFGMLSNGQVMVTSNAQRLEDSQTWSIPPQGLMASTGVPQKFNGAPSALSNGCYVNVKPNHSGGDLQTYPKPIQKPMGWGTEHGMIPRPVVPTAPKQLKCKRCMKRAIFICSGCKNAWYCTPECQRLDWTNHFSICR